MGIIATIFYVFWSTFRMLAANEFSFCNWFFWVKASALKRLYIWCIINVLKRGGVIRRFWLRNANRTQLGKLFLQLMVLGDNIFTTNAWKELVFYAKHKAKTICSPNVTSSVALSVAVACGAGWSKSRVSS